MSGNFQDKLRYYLEISGFKTGQLAKLTGLSRRTILNWLGRVSKPHQWQDIIVVAKAMKLGIDETNELLVSANYPTLDKLRTLFPDKTKLFSGWLSAPFQVPPANHFFVGRENLILQIRESLTTRDSNILCLQGMAGVGKTSLAIYVAYLVKSDFSDGVLWASLNRTDPMSILASFANALGKDVSKVSDIANRASLVRGLLADKSVLIILDNVDSSEQLEFLLPPSSGKPCAIITTQNDLAIADDFERLKIPAFDVEKDEAHLFFEKRLGISYARKYKAQLSEISNILEQLPLAITIIAGILNANLGINPNEILENLRQDDLRLNILARENRSVRLSFEYSFHKLPQDIQEFYTTLSTFRDCELFDINAIATITNFSQEKIITWLKILSNASLIDDNQSGRFKIHSLLSDFLNEKISSWPTKERNYLNLSMVNYYFAYVENTQQNFHQIDLEIVNIKAALKRAMEYGLNEPLAKSVVFLFEYWSTHGDYEQLAHWLSIARESTTQLGKDELAAEIYLLSGKVARFQGDLTGSESFLKIGYDIAQKCGNPGLICSFLSILGTLSYIKDGNYPQSKNFWQQGLRLAKDNGLKSPACNLLINLGLLADSEGNFIEADNLYASALVLARELGDPQKISRCLQSRATTLFNLANYDEAGLAAQEAYELAENIGDKLQMSHALSSLAAAGYYQGKLTEAEKSWRQGLQIVQEMGYEAAEPGMFTNISAVLVDKGYYKKAKETIEKAIKKAQSFGQIEDLCYALEILGAIYLAEKKYTKAKQNLLDGFEQANKLGNIGLICSFSIALGDLYLNTDRLSDAEIFFTDAQNLASEVGNNQYKCASFLSSSRLEMKREKITSAYELASQALEVATETKMPKLIADAKFLIAQTLLDTQQQQAMALAKESLEIFEHMGHHKKSEVLDFLNRASNTIENV